jgi:hypothetical protein
MMRPDGKGNSLDGGNSGPLDGGGSSIMQKGGVPDTVNIHWESPRTSRNYKALKVPDKRVFTPRATRPKTESTGNTGISGIGIAGATTTMATEDVRNTSTLPNIKNVSEVDNSFRKVICHQEVKGMKEERWERNDKNECLV